MNLSEKKVILLIRDGWGYREEKENNFLTAEYAPITNKLLEKYPNTLLKCSGADVGLPDGYQGNSEVGHMAIGSGRIIFQSLVRINKSISDGDFFNIPVFLSAIENCKTNKSALHLIGLLQTEGVHSHISHLFALLDLCKRQNFDNIYIHAITDGRDAPVNDGANQLAALQNKIMELGFGKIATISGRYFAMDRDKRWDRTEQAYNCIVNGEGEEYSDPIVKIKGCYLKNENDEFIVPSKLTGYEGVKSNDSIIFFNFRTDRVRQLTQAIVENDFEGWDRKPLNVFFVCMTQYYNPMNAGVAFIDQNLNNLLGEVISKEGLKQLRISETEKYAHVTFFFNGQKEGSLDGEDRVLISSPKVATYDLKPEMSANEVAEKVVDEINSNKYNFVVVNLVNCDMVGHTGIREAIIKAVSVVDSCTGKIVDAGLVNNYAILVCADHGNAEDKGTENNTNHTKNPIPFILISNEENLMKIKLKDDCGLSAIAPTVLELLDIKKPEEMTGKSLIS